MNPTKIGVVVFAFAFGGVLLGMWLRSALPKHHLDVESRDTIKVGIGLIATMTALVLGLVTASAKNAYDAVDSAVKETATHVLALDRVLSRFGSETGPIRAGLKQAVGDRIDAIWPKDGSAPVNLDPSSEGSVYRVEGLADAIRSLRPKNEIQSALQTHAVDLAETMLQARWLVLAGTEISVPTPFLVVLLFWLTVTFASFGLFAPRNGTVITVLFVCALSIGGALFLVLEMDGPFDGLLRVSPDPLRFAHSHINR